MQRITEFTDHIFIVNSKPFNPKINSKPRDGISNTLRKLSELASNILTNANPGNILTTRMRATVSNIVAPFNGGF